MKNNQKGNKVIKAAMFGSLAGGVIGLLFAPKSGHELRLDIAGQANKTEQKAKAIRNKAQSTWQNVENQTQLTLNTGKNLIKKGKLMASNLKILVSEIRQGALTKDGSLNLSDPHAAVSGISDDVINSYYGAEDNVIEDNEDLTKEI